VTGKYHNRHTEEALDGHVEMAKQWPKDENKEEDEEENEEK